MTAPEPEVVHSAIAELAEGPLWDSDRQVLWWVDIHRGVVYRTNASGTVEIVRMDSAVGCVVLRRQDGLALATSRGIMAVDLATRDRSLIAATPDSKRGMRLNDGKCDARGRFWFGSVADDFCDGAGSLYCLAPGVGLRVAVSGVTCSNGLDWSIDGRTMYYIDSPTRTVDAFDFDVLSGAISNRRTLIQFGDEPGNPDGMTVDASGALWIALWDGWGINRYAPDGSPIGRIQLPVARVTSCAFGGPQLSDLYITTARWGLSEEELSQQPLAGSLFRYRADVRGRIAHRFAG